MEGGKGDVKKKKKKILGWLHRGNNKFLTIMKCEAVEGLVPRDITMCFHCSHVSNSSVIISPTFYSRCISFIAGREHGMHKSHLYPRAVMQDKFNFKAMQSTSICSTSYKIRLNDKCIVIRIDQLYYCFSVYASKYT